MGKCFLDFSFWTLGYMTVQTAHCALYYSLKEDKQMCNGMHCIMMIVYCCTNVLSHDCMILPWFGDTLELSSPNTEPAPIIDEYR